MPKVITEKEAFPKDLPSRTQVLSEEEAFGLEGNYTSLRAENFPELGDLLPGAFALSDDPFPNNPMQDIEHEGLPPVTEKGVIDKL